MSKSTFASVFAAVEPMLYLLLLPIALLSDPRLLPVLVIVPILWGVNFWLTGRPWPRTRLNLPLYLMLLMIAVSAWATPDLQLSLPKIVGLAFAIFFFWAAVSFAGRSRITFQWAVMGYLGLALAIIAVALVKTTFTAKIAGLGGVVAVLGQVNRLAAGLPLPAINANQVAGVLMWVTPLAIGVTAAAVQVRRRSAGRQGEWGGVSRLWLPLGGLTLLFLGTLLLTQSRTGWAAFAIACLVMGWLAGGRLRQAAALVIIIGLIGVGVLWFADGDGRGQNVLTTAAGLRSDALVDGSAIGTLNGRLEIWSRAIYGIQDFPITGMGMNVFREVVHVLYPLFLIPPTIDVAHAHNHLLQTGLDLGIPGLIGYVAIWISAVQLIWELWRQHPSDPFLRPLLIGFSGSLVAYWLYGLTDTVALGAKPGFLWWLLLALLVGLENFLRSHPPPPLD